MSALNLWLIAVALAMDCFAVSIASGIILKHRQWHPMLTMALFFGLFQGLMPLIGWAFFSSFNSLIENVDHWIAFGILLCLGGKMVTDCRKEEEERTFDPTKLKVVAILAVATSIDALAIGISFACLRNTSYYNIWESVSIIGLTSFVLSMTGLELGIRYGKSIERKIPAELAGGIILILIGIKILVEHLTQTT